MFMNPNPAPRRTLADIILEKITEKQSEIQTQFSEVESKFIFFFYNEETNFQIIFVSGVKFQDIDPRVKALYQGVASVLHRYRSGKLPKAFKLIPSLQNWEQILYITGNIFFFFCLQVCLLNVVSITDPEKWSAAAMVNAFNN